MILRVVLALVQEKLPRYVNAQPSDIQVLTPMRKGALGVENLNRVLQRYLNPAARTSRSFPSGTALQAGRTEKIRRAFCGQATRSCRYATIIS